MRDSLAEYNQIAGTNLQLRIGLNSGLVVAGVIGKRRFLYDLWGDSMDTASRIETRGIPGEIQVTEATRELLEVGSRFTFIDRGLIDIKGKGPMQTYLLQPNGHAKNGRRQPSPVKNTGSQPATLPFCNFATLPLFSPAPAVYNPAL